ncbi:hypothetical protein BU23DRAFT_590319 [Bimuria novae-zelandiae CBS 107.79]|uniref:protein-ribulosamine 3-kinase n=1 Tax=Bimuria novae-zelandiae CBS 107.79 TaxID=1447943 RepID=A0A6A5V7E9_9PLEO|nr:hypothetical protein BU23DRAFT_590319 [Bimuria novae-zelandiae CBS 107.79]
MALVSGQTQGRIDIKLSDGAEKSFFIKTESKDVDKNMLTSEFESMKAIHHITSAFALKPVAWGTYHSIPDIHFFLSEFLDMLPNMPDPDKFAARLSALHQTSKSPNGKFEFHYTGWEDSWETFFSKSMRQALDLEILAKGYDPEFDTLVPAIFDKAIPRLFRPLESEGRSIKPSPVHGDLWYGNSGIERGTGEPLVFDAYEFGQWKPVCNRFGAEYVDAYHANVGKSSPKEDFDGRVYLYKLWFNTHVSALFPDDATLREQYVEIQVVLAATDISNRMLGDMRDLVARYVK